MKKTTLYILGTIAIIILAIVYSFSDFSVMNILPMGSLPTQYQGYHEIRTGLETPSYRTELLFKLDNEGRFYDYHPLFNAMNNTVIIGKQKDVKPGEDSSFIETYLKLDANGNAIDSLIYKEDWPTNSGGYLLTPHGYCSWIIDGDKQVHPYIELNRALTEDSASLAKHYKQLYQDGKLITCYSQFDLEDAHMEALKADKAIFYQHGQLIALFGKKLSDMYYQGYKEDYVSPVNAMANRADNERLEKHNPFVYMDYFQKEHYRKAQGPSLGSETGNSSPNKWEGSAYLNVILKKDTLHIKQDMTKDDDGVPPTMSPYDPPFQTCYFTCGQINFGLFANDNFEMYIIKKKKK